MIQAEMRAKSAEKVKQVLSLMKVLNLNVEARQRITEEGFIELQTYWVDKENYPIDPELADDGKGQVQEMTVVLDAPTGETAPAEVAPTGETAA